MRDRERICAALFAWMLLIVASILWIDRPVSLFVHAHFHDAKVFPLLTHLSDVVVPTAVAGLIGFALAGILEARPGWLGRDLLALFVAVAVAVVVKDELKLLFGRTWPETWVDGNPSFIRDAVYGFFPLHGGAGWASFPSGHTTVMVTLAAAMWHRWPRLSRLAGVMALLVVVGLLGANYHFVSDILAGAMLGWILGRGVPELLLRVQIGS